MTIKQIGQRMTSQRKLLLDIIRNTQGHLDADELFLVAKKKDPKISLSTVYRNLNLLKEMGLVAERHFIDEHHHYELKGSSDHCHLVCKSCSKVFEFESSVTEQLRNKVSTEMKFTATDIEISMQGVCFECAKQI